ncbi:uncharacterized protein LOC108669901 [Hyalella azteca]|uniref:Uncharacterized protein LOC108669901 n=1 Tax=Hyalella azteca TaxID=294128 RepID=A0A979FQ92_HYAAZ|nr:uncharacterized protein LOC108669901 [Hyalella azteca]
MASEKCMLLVFCLFGLAAQTRALDDYLTDEAVDEEGRFFFPIIIGSGSGLSLNITQLAAIAALLSSGLLGLLGLAALGFLLFSLLHDRGDSGYGSGSGYGGGGGGYNTYSSYRRSFDPYAIDWEKFSILDWISIGEEAWRKFDPADLDCQKRLICEIHQNTSKVFFWMSTFWKYLPSLDSYLQYAEVLSLPEEFKALVEEYLDAADRGRNLQKECGEIYSSCEFSVKKMVDKFSHNEI